MWGVYQEARYLNVGALCSDFQSVECILIRKRKKKGELNLGTLRKRAKLVARDIFCWPKIKSEHRAPYPSLLPLDRHPTCMRSISWNSQHNKYLSDSGAALQTPLWLIHSLNNSLSHPLVPTDLRHRHAQRVWESYSICKKTCHSDKELSKSWRAWKLHHWFKSYGHFGEGVDLASWWSCIGKGLR